MELLFSVFILTLSVYSVVQAAPWLPPRYDGGLPARCSSTALQLPTFNNLRVLNVDARLFQNYTLGLPPIPGLEEVLGGAVPSITGLNFCNVTVTYTHPGWNDSVNVNTFLPFEWNGRFLANGGGGFVTGSPQTAMLTMLLGQTQAYAQSNTDGGHTGDPSPSNPWPLTSTGNLNWPLLVDFSSSALHDMAVVGKAVIQTFYHTAPKYSYFYGGSTGGRQGHMLAQRYPEDFDGIVGHYPAIYWNRILASMAWPVFMMDRLSYYPPPCELDVITSAAIAECDEQDGVKDGIISHPSLCEFDPESFVGKEASCNGTSRTISSEAATIMRAAWEGPRSSTGEFQWYGYNPGTNISAPGGIAYNICDAQGNNCTPQPFSIPYQWASYFVKKDPTYTLRNISHEEWDEIVHNAVVEFESIIETNDVDLTKLRKSGTKLLNWHGTGDPLIPVNGSSHYYDRVLAQQPDAPGYYRLFIAPGAVHGFTEGIAPRMESVLTQMVDWVEKGVTPETLFAQGTSTEGVLMKRDLCLYPRVQHYTGGNFTSATSYTCV